MSKLITAKVLSERKYGDKDKVKIVVPSRVSPEVYDNDGIDPNDEKNDYTQMAMVACNNNLAKDDLVWISYLDIDKTQPVIVSPYWGKTSSDNFDTNAGTDPNDPSQGGSGFDFTLADLAVVITAYGECTQPLTKKLDPNDIQGLIKDSFYASYGPQDGKSIGIRQWTGAYGRAQKVYKYVYDKSPTKAKKLGSSGKISDSANVIKKTMSSSFGKEGQYEFARDKDPTEPLSKLVKSCVKEGIKDNACILYFIDICNQYGASMDNKNRKSFIAAYKKLGTKNLKNFHNKMMSMDPGKYSNRRKYTYQNVKKMKDAGWLEGSAGNLTNVSKIDTTNNKTGWIYPILDPKGEFKIFKKWNHNNGILLSHEKGKSEGKKAVSMYKGKVKNIKTVGSSYTVEIEMRTKTNAKHYVEYCSLDTHSVEKGDSVSKNTEIGKLKSNGLHLKVHYDKTKGSKYIDPTELIGLNISGIGSGFGGDPGKFIWYYQMNGGKYFNHNYGGSIAGGKNASEACGIFSVAMIWTSFSGDKKSYVPSKMTNGKGTGIAQKWGAFGKSGLFSQGGFVTATNKHKSKLRCRASGQKSGMPSLKTIKSVVGKGGVILCCAHGYYGDNFYTTGHYFVITGLTKNNKMILADPGWKGRAYYKYTDPGGVKGTNRGASVKFKHGGNGNPNYYYNIYPA